MKRIYFIRHAEAQSGGISDFERKLSPRGKEDAMKLASNRLKLRRPRAYDSTNHRGRARRAASFKGFARAL